MPDPYHISWKGEGRDNKSQNNSNVMLCIIYYIFEDGTTIIYQHPDYITLNVSSPNTPGLRSLQSGDQLERMLDFVKTEQGNQKRHVPLLLKVAPDLESKDIELISEKILQFQIDGLIATNTTVERPKGMESEEPGGLSGSPVFQLSKNVLARFRQSLPKPFPIIGVGGISDEVRAAAMVQAGADLLQIYTGFIYKGTKIVQKLSKI